MIILKEEVQKEIENCCKAAQLDIRYEMEHAIQVAVEEAYKRGYKEGAKRWKIKPE